MGNNNNATNDNIESVCTYTTTFLGVYNRTHTNKDINARVTTITILIIMITLDLPTVQPILASTTGHTIIST